MTPDTFGPESREPLAIYDPASRCWKMSGGMFPSDSMPSLATLPPWGMTRGGELFELPMPVLPTVEPESSSLLPTPTTEPMTGNGHARNLGKEAQLLPTPKTTDAKSHSPADAKRNEPGLRAVEYLLPTPVSDNSRGLPSTSTDYASLANVAAALLPTPAVNDMGAGKTPE
jgi:hypothetical protein